MELSGLDALSNYMFDMNVEDYDIIKKELEVVNLLRHNTAYSRALCDKTKSRDNNMIVFEIKGLVDEETWRKIYEVFKGPVL